MVTEVYKSYYQLSTRIFQESIPAWSSSNGDPLTASTTTS